MREKESVRICERVCVCMYVCVRERVCVSVCVCEREILTNNNPIR